MMRTYVYPEMEIKRFNRENIVTSSFADPAAYVESQLGADINGGTGKWNQQWSDALKAIELTL